MSRLYEIPAELEECYDPETGEFDEDRYNELQGEREDILEYLALKYKNALSDAEQIKAEEAALNSRRKACEREAESLKAVLSRELEGSKLETPRVKISWRKSKSVVVAENFISWAIATGNDCYLRHKEPEVDKTAIKNALASGADIPAELVENNNISIK